ncbi:DUF692 family multinuclear iron-containing protein [Streptomyces sp. NPDC086766]|uniref:multinuclear nonheme iron-dependent oxidase n=1 Tax=Streptomyces sp. NPDC086766 TaxID=3365754 RepID=UPI00380773AD
MERLGTGIGWRPEIADAVEHMPGVDWVEVVAENVCPGHLPESLLRLRARGVTVVPHGVGLGLGGAERPDEARLTALAERAQALGSPLVTEHIAFVRGGGPLTASPRLKAGHLLPVPRTRDALDVLCENVRIAQEALPVPLAVENVAALLAWPAEEMTEGQFLYELADRTGVRLLIDVANLHTNHVNRGEDPAKALAELPVEAIAYVHVAGGFERDGVWHDSHAHPVPRPVLGILTDLASRVSPPGVLLERDENFPEPAELERELEAIRQAVHAGRTTAAIRPGTPTAPRPANLAADGRRPAATAAVRDPANPTAVPDRAVPTATALDPAVPAATGSRPVDPATAPESSDTAVSPPAHTASTAVPPQAGPAAGARPAAPGAGPRPGPDGAPREAGPLGGARQRVALAQTALLSALVAGTPAPEGFDRVRLGVQARALASKRAGVVAKVAPELPVILGEGYRSAFLDYAHGHPMTGGYRRDAMEFAAFLLDAGRPRDVEARRVLREWWRERSGPAPRSRRPAVRISRAARRILSRR